jgi:hypothetical protein
MSIQMRVAGADGELMAVPALHYRMAFAHVVHQATRDDESRPDAVAVELGPQATAIIASWMRELGPTERLPCMLGLLRRNRLIHPRHRETCLALQERHGVPLHRVPMGQLLRSCDFSPTSLICISAVDSVIEAIRSAVEHGLDVYGIDLEESASGKRQQVLLEDPAMADMGFAAYVERNAGHCAGYRDDYVDNRREWHMAGQLRFLLSKYRRVLFTGGLAHWSTLQRLLQLPDPPARPPLPVSEECRYAKVIVDPNLAICQMDAMPNYTSHYEDLRARATSRLSFPDPLDFLQHAYREVMNVKRGQMLDAHTSLARYFVYIENLLLLRQRHTVDFVTALEAAAAIVSPEMACRLQKVMVAN